MTEIKLKKKKKRIEKKYKKTQSHVHMLTSLGVSNFHPWGFLMFIYQKQEIVTQQKGSGLCTSCLHPRMCVCVYVIRGETRQAGPGEDAKQLHSSIRSSKISLHREAAFNGLQAADVCVRLACLTGKKISACLCTYQGEHEEEIPRHTYMRKTACQRCEASKKEADNLGICLCSKK